MTQGEFKAWFEGFAEAIGGVPNKTQWERIKARAAEIDGRTVTERVYVDRYIDRQWPPLYPRWATYGLTGGGGVTYTANAAGAANSMQSVTKFSSPDAMFALGKHEGAMS